MNSLCCCAKRISTFNLLYRAYFNNAKPKKYRIPDCFRNYTTGSNLMKVTVIGSAGKIGQPLCLMLKQSPLIDELCIHDLKPTQAFANELNHIDTKCKVIAFTGRDGLEEALQNSKVVVMLASSFNAQFLPVDKMWSHNAGIVKEVAHAFTKCCPKAFLAIGTNPINSTVPMASEVIKKTGSYNPNAVFGITSLDTVRANTFVAQMLGLEPECVVVPVVGGHTPETIVPVLSQAKPCNDFTNEELESLTSNIKKAHDNLIKLRPPESGSLAGAFATARFVISLVKATRGYPDIIETAFVRMKENAPIKYMSIPVQLGSNGIMKILGVPKLTDFEECLYENATPPLQRDIKLGEAYVGVVDPPPVCDPSQFITRPDCCGEAH